MAVERPELRIIPQALWDAVQTRLSAEAERFARQSSGFAHKGETGRRSAYLLSGFARCAICGGALVGKTGTSGSGKERVPYRSYVCSHRTNRGATVCGNNHAARTEQLDSALAEVIRSTILAPKAVDRVISQALKKVREAGRSKIVDELESARRQQTRVQAEIANLVQHLANGHMSQAVTQSLAEKEAFGKELASKISDLEAQQPIQVSQINVAEIKEAICARMRELEDLFSSHVNGAREAMRTLFADTLIAYPTFDERGKKSLQLKGHTVIGWLVAGSDAENRIRMASPRGFEPRLSP
ncbi:MAG: recombinase zinc beta ribbon domain-containing protein [Burkholderiales bacterium]|nr:recombinase zinc beta ribbon domain-containing protein [Burkholderiales bacterium]